ETLEPEAWYCTMVWSAYLGLPLSLEKAAQVLQTDQQKNTEGRALIRYFSIPCKPTKANGQRTRNIPSDDRIKWRTFIEYNKQDVETELAIQERLAHFPMPDSEWAQYHIDQRINDAGIQIDPILVDQAITFDDQLRE